MTHNCYNCANLDPEKKNPGKVDGCLYFCKKQKRFVNAAKDGCEKWARGGRQPYKDDELYDDGKRYYNDNTPAWLLVTILILLIILGLIYGIFK